MIDAGFAATSAQASGTSAGAMLRRAREAQNMPVEALAAATKVVPKKLEALEADRHDLLPDATFARALAQTICRQLKIDPAPVLAQLPPLPVPHRLERVAAGLNTPFRERSGRMAAQEWSRSTWTVLGIALALSLSALAIYLLPSRSNPAREASSSSTGVTTTTTTVGTPGSVDGSVSGSGSSSAAAAAPSGDGVVVTSIPGPGDTRPAAEPEATPSTAPATPASAVAATVAEAAPAGWLQLAAVAPSWVEVVDASGRSMISRVLQTGESVSFDGTPPMRVKIGNARDTRLTLRGRPYDLAAHTKDNVARLDVR